MLFLRLVVVYWSLCIPTSPLLQPHSNPTAFHLHPHYILAASPMHPYFISFASPLHLNSIPDASLLHLFCIPAASPFYPTCIPAASLLHPSCIPAVSPFHPSCIPVASQLHYYCIPHSILSASLLHPVVCAPSIPPAPAGLSCSRVAATPYGQRREHAAGIYRRRSAERSTENPKKRRGVSYS